MQQAKKGPTASEVGSVFEAVVDDKLEASQTILLELISKYRHLIDKAATQKKEDRNLMLYFLLITAAERFGGFDEAWKYLLDDNRCIEMYCMAFTYFVPEMDNTNVNFSTRGKQHSLKLQLVPSLGRFRDVLKRTKSEDGMAFARSLLEGRPAIFRAVLGGVPGVCDTHTHRQCVAHAVMELGSYPFRFYIHDVVSLIGEDVSGSNSAQQWKHCIVVRSLLN